MEISKLAKLFGKNRLVGLAGEKNVGKTNNIIALLIDFRKTNKDTPIYLFGFELEVSEWLKKLGNVYTVSKLEHLIGKKNAIFFIDEFQKLRLNNRRSKEVLDDFVSMIYHPDQNNYAVLCSPSLREFNSIIGGKIERWALKTTRKSSLINGSQLKKAVEDYCGAYKILGDIVMPPNKLLIVNENIEEVIELDYIKEVDTKSEIVDIFAVKRQEIVPEKDKKLSKELSEKDKASLMEVNLL